MGFEALKYVARPNRRVSGANLTHRQVSSVLIGERWPSRLWRMNMLGIRPPDLPLEYFFDLPDFHLHFAGVLFGVAFNLQVGIIRDFAGRLFDSAFRFVNSAFDLSRRTGVHLFSPCVE
jgi:hypothetical protein